MMYRINKIISVILALAMITGFMPAFTTANAIQVPQPGEEYDESVEAIDNVSSKEDNEISDVVEHEAPQEEAAEEHGEDIDETISEEPDGDKTEKETRSLEQALRECLAEVIAGSGVEVKASSVKELNDFAGNKYYLVEFKDGGYMICHGATGELMEYATEGKSPYYGYSDGLIYLAATHYYHLDNGYYVDNLENTQKITPTNENVSKLIEKSNIINGDILNNSNKRVRQNDAEIPDIDSLTVNITESSGNTKGVNAGYSIPGHQNIACKTTQSAMGYIANYCGYIATGIVLSWIDKSTSADYFLDDLVRYNYTPSVVHGTSNAYFANTGLASELQSYAGNGWGNGANSYRLELILNGYSNQDTFFDAYQLSGTVTRLSGSDCTMGNIRTTLYSVKVPIILIDDFDYLYITGVSNHAVVAYGYDANNGIMIHTGIPGNAIMTVTNNAYLTFDEALYITNPNSTISITDSGITTWQKNAAKFVLTYDYMSFKSGSLFKPNDNALRGDFVKSIHALAGYPTLSSNDPKIAEFQTNFPEVPLGSTYYDAAVWAYAKGILTGILNNQGVIYLGLDEPLTREQAATFFYRLYNQSGVTFHMRISGGPSYTTFTDYASVHTYARTPINWATTHYIIEGAGNYLYPLENLKRAELAKMILNFCNSTKKG